MFHPLLLTQSTGRVVEYCRLVMFTTEEKVGLREEKRGLLVLVWSCGYCNLKARLDATVPFRSRIPTTLFPPFRNGEKTIFIAKTAARLSCPICGKQELTGVGGKGNLD